MNQPVKEAGDDNAEQSGVLRFPVSDEDLIQFNWQQELEDVDGPYDRWGHVVRLADRARELEAVTPAHAAVLRLLSAVISLHLVVNSSRPFMAAIRRINSRSADPEDFNLLDLAVLTKMAEQTQSPWLRARLADVGLIVSQDHGSPSWKLGAMAAQAYLDHARRDGKEHDVDRRESLQRAMDLGWRYLRRDELFHAALWESAMALMRKGLDESKPGVSVPIANEIRRRNRQLAAEVAELFERQGDLLFGQSASPLASDTYREAANLWQAANNRERAEVAHHRSAEVLIALARAPGQAMLQADWMAEGIAILRRHRGNRAYIRELQIELAEIRARITGEMSAISHSIDTTEIVAHIEARMTAENLPDALIQLAFSFSTWVNAGKVRSRVIKTGERFIFSSIFRHVTYDDSGVPIDVTAPFDASNEEELERRIVQQVSQIDHSLLARIAIPSALDILQTRFEPTMADLMGLLYESPSTPRGHEWTLARGLLAGLNYDWEEAAVFLIPQAEPFVRAAFKRHGVNTLSNKEDGIEEEKSLTELLAHAEAGTVLSQDLLLELKTLLTHKAGHNLRNLYGHGLISDGNLANVGTIVLWWTMLRLVLWPYRGRAVQLMQVMAAEVSVTTEQIVEEPPR